MSAVDGVPVDKCPKCGMDQIENFQGRYFFFQCGTPKDLKVQTSTCKRIAELKAEVLKLREEK